MEISKNKSKKSTGKNAGKGEREVAEGARDGQEQVRMVMIQRWRIKKRRIMKRRIKKRRIKKRKIKKKMMLRGDWKGRQPREEGEEQRRRERDGKWGGARRGPEGRGEG